MKAIRLLSKYLGGDPPVDCSGKSSCPAIMEADNGDFLIIGKKTATNADLNDFACVGDDEQLVVIPREVLLKAKDLL